MIFCLFLKSSKAFSVFLSWFIQVFSSLIKKKLQFPVSQYKVFWKTSTNEYFSDSKCCHLVFLVRHATPVNIYLFQIKSRNARKKGGICSTLTIKTPERRYWRHSGVFIVNFEHISHLFSSVSFHVFVCWDCNLQNSIYRIVCKWVLNELNWIP